MSNKTDTVDTDRAVTLFCFRVFDDLRKKGRSYQDIAEEFSISKAWVQNIYKECDAHTVGQRLEQTLARKFYRGSVDALRTDAVRLARENSYPLLPGGGKRKGSTLAPGGDMIRRFSNAQLAAEWVARELKVSRDRCAAMAAENRFGLSQDAGVEEWRSAIKLTLSGASKKVTPKSV